MPHIDTSLTYAWLIPLLPLIGFVINGSIGGKLPKAVSGGLATAAVFGSFIAAISLFLKVTGAPDDARTFVVPGFQWLGIGADVLNPAIHSLQVNFELLIDPLSVLMMLIITGVGGLIHLYSTAYMAADKNYSRFFTYLNLFVFFMLLLVMGNNFLQLFVGWEGVGLCSYLLIGYFFEKKSAGDAAKKAFIVNRIGDVGVLIGMFMIFKYFGTLDFHFGTSGVPGILDSVAPLAAHASQAVVTTLLLMLFFGATGKSAQIPLYVWLPDAMEGPTPVSALIHAATMVTAGIYMVSRMHSVFVLSDTAMITVAVIGIATALFAATIGLMQNDIKRVLAYSTVSQLGYMFAACGAGAFAAGMYHVMTHAFFKACLFLGSGSVIHAIEHGMHAKGHDNPAAAEHGDVGNHELVGDGPDPHDPQDMRNMGGLFGRIKITAVTMIIATCAIAGLPPLSGYWSKGEILWYSWSVSSVGGENWVFWGVGALTALITAFYMFRLVMKTFFGPARSEAAKTAHESSPAIYVPLIILAILAAGTGWAFLPFETFAKFLEPSVGALPTVPNISMKMPLEIGITIGVVLSVLACVSAYRNSKTGQLQSPQSRADRHILGAGWLYSVVLNKYYVDEAYNLWFVKYGKRFANWLYLTFDVGIVDGIVNGVDQSVRAIGSVARRSQTGYVRNYAFSMVVGILIVVIGCLAGLSHGH